MVELNARQYNIINEIIYQLNAETSLDKLRVDLLAAIELLIPNKRSLFDLGRRANHQVVFYSPIARNMADEFLDSYYQTYQHIDPMYWFFSQNRTEIYRESDLVSEEMQEGSMFYQEWSLPQDIHYSIGSVVTYGGLLYGSVNLWRSKNDKDFSDEDKDILSIINRHLSLRFGRWFPNGFKESVSGEYAGDLAKLYHLTPREIEIAALLYEGHTLKDIGDILFIGIDTVKKHNTHILKKMKVDNRIKLVKIIRDHMTD